MTWRTATLACCSLGCGPTLESSVQGPFRALEGVLPAGRDGVVAIDLVPEPGETALLVTGVPVDPTLQTHVRALILPGGGGYSGTEETSGDRKRSNAGYVGDVATLNWPITPSDPGLQIGEVHRLELGLVADLGYTPGWLQVTVLFASDDTPRDGVLPVDLVHFGEVGRDPDLRAAVEGALVRWRELYAGLGITLDIEERFVDGEGIGMPTGDDLLLWRHLASTGPPLHLRVVLAPELPGDEEGVVGAAGDVPASLVPTGRTGVRITPSRICGVDGVCDSAEAALYGEVIAHEVGHHLGLFHPVEVGWDAWDALPDTVECSGQLACEVGLGGNLMFPYTVCGQDGCAAQAEVSAQQRAVLHGYVGVE